MNAGHSPVLIRNPRPVKLRLAPLLLLALLPACGREGLMTTTGGIYARRSPCPIVGVPAATGDITLFSPAGRSDAAAIDVSATMTNVRGSCNDSGDDVVSTVSFDVVGIRRDPTEARQVILPYFAVVLQGGSEVVAKKVGYIALNFAAGQYRAQTAGQAVGRVNRGAATLPEETRRILTRERRPGDADAAVDPLNDPAVREAVARATFEQLVGFQLTQEQLRYNATR